MTNTTTSIDLAQLDKLEALAKAIPASGTFPGAMAAFDAFYAAANPATVQQLLALARRSLTSGAPASSVEALSARLEAMGVTNIGITPGANATPEKVASEIMRALDQIEAGAAAKTEQAPGNKVCRASDGCPDLWKCSSAARGDCGAQATAAGAGSAQLRAEQTLYEYQPRHENGMLLDWTKLDVDTDEEARDYCVPRGFEWRRTTAGQGAQPHAEGDERALPPLPPYDWLEDHLFKYWDEKSMKSYARAALARAPLPAQGGMAGDVELIQVPAHEADSYCRILSILGMEEEGDPVAEVQRLFDAAARYHWIRSQEASLETRQRDKSIVNGPSCYHEVEGIRELKCGAELDSSIDAAMRANDGAAEGGK